MSVCRRHSEIAEPEPRSDQGEAVGAGGWARSRALTCASARMASRAARVAATMVQAEREWRISGSRRSWSCSAPAARGTFAALWRGS